MIDNYMKTFAEYIEEAVDFRLGGKANKGDEVEPVFKDLRNGDKLYFHEWEMSKQGFAKFDAIYEVVVDEVKREKDGMYHITGKGFDIKNLSEEQMEMTYYAYTTVSWRGTHLNAVSTVKYDKRRLNELFELSREYIEKFPF